MTAGTSSGSIVAAALAYPDPDDKGYKTPQYWGADIV
jgi:patatin-like phospholipase/acyl hydrolase